jgi:hypothetical protein
MTTPRTYVAAALAAALAGACSSACQVAQQTAAATNANCGPTLVLSAPDDCTPSVAASGAHTGNVLVSWTANREKGVNSIGGGYRVEYSTSPDFPGGSTTMIDIPYVSGPTTPTAYSLTGLDAGNYCLRITAYSALNTTGSYSLTQVGVP